MFQNVEVHVAVGLFTVLCLLGSGCRGSGGPDTAAENETADTTAVGDTSDTTQEADSTTGMTDEPPPPPAPAPGTAEVRATILSVDTTGATPQGQIRIEKVLGYGSSTPPLSTGDRTVALFPGVLQNWAVNDLLAGEAHFLVLQHSGDQLRQRNQAAQEEHLEWSIQSIAHRE